MSITRGFSAIVPLALFCFVVLPARAQRETLVSGVSIVSAAPLQLEVRTSGRVSPQAEIVPDPERLVIDIPNAIPTAALHNLTINRGEVKRVRTSLFSRAPAVTRVVVDLGQPQWYRITPAASGFIVSLGSDNERAAEGPAAQKTIGWVSTRAPARKATGATGRIIVQQRAIGEPIEPASGVRVQFANGLLRIHSAGATLSEVLFEIVKQTGAEIAIPAGSEQEHVAADFGPGPAREVLAELLNGSGLNFVVVGSENDPTKLRRVILSRKTEEVGAREGFTPTYPPPGAEANFEQENGGVPALDENGPQPEQPQPQPEQVQPQVPPPSLGPPPPE